MSLIWERAVWMMFDIQFKLTFPPAHAYLLIYLTHKQNIFHGLAYRIWEGDNFRAGGV